VWQRASGAEECSVIELVFFGSVAADEKFATSPFASAKLRLGPSAHGSSFTGSASNERKLSRGYLRARPRCSENILGRNGQETSRVAVGCSAWLGDGAYELRPALRSVSSSVCLIASAAALLHRLAYSATASSRAGMGEWSRVR